MDSNSRFLLKSFRKYYKDNPIIMPSRFGRREFGFMFFDRNFVQRHMGFSRPEDINKFMITQVPSHSYYSTAYYRKPDAPTMEEKMWLGADLIFDLDADHLEGADKMSYSEMLEQIKKEMINLVDSFLLGDLGFTDKQVQNRHVIVLNQPQKRASALGHVSGLCNLNFHPYPPDLPHRQTGHCSDVLPQ